MTRAASVSQTICFPKQAAVPPSPHLTLCKKATIPSVFFQYSTINVYSMSLDACMGSCAHKRIKNVLDPFMIT